MELIVINENKLKIMMNESELKLCGLNENDFYCGMADTRKILYRILSQSPIYTGFEAHRENERLLLQLYPEKDGGCELFITRLPSFCDYISDKEESKMPRTDPNPHSDDKHLLPIVRARQSEIKRLCLCYRFDRLEYVRAACVELKARSFSGESTLFLSDDGKYCLFLIPEENRYAKCEATADKTDKKERTGRTEKSSPSSYLSEFGELQNSEYALMYVSEYASCVYERDAVEQMCDK